VQYYDDDDDDNDAVGLRVVALKLIKTLVTRIDARHFVIAFLTCACHSMPVRLVVDSSSTL
jgi:hypothetical protein